jgi:hypothetical protein
MCRKKLTVHEGNRLDKAPRAVAIRALQWRLHVVLGFAVHFGYAIRPVTRAVPDGQSPLPGPDFIVCSDFWP